MYFLETLQVRAVCHGGVLYSFWYWWNVVLNFLNIEKRFKYFFLNISCFLHVLCYFQHFLENHCFFISRFVLFSTYIFFFGNIQKCPVPYWLKGRWVLQIVDGDSGNLYPIYPLFPCSDFFISNVGVVWGGGAMFFFHYMLFATFLEKNYSGNTFFFRNTILFHLMFSSCFLC